MALKKSELYSSLWASCDELRGGMDASQYKDYVLVLLFVKYVSDRYADQPYAPINIPQGASFADMVALKGKTDIGDQINKKVLGPLAQANKLSDVPDFNDPNKLGSGKEMVERLTNLIAIFENPALDFSQNRADGDDLLGDAYEYLMRHFATESGKSKGQFYTPAEVSRIIAQILGIRHAKVSNDTTVYDPTCGSGSLLLKIGDEARHGGKEVKVTLYGQEKDNATAGLARMNMILHDYATAEVRQGNTIASPLYLDGDALKTFDYVVANPPFSDKRWSTGLDAEHDPWQRFQHYGIPPGKQGDYAYLLHILRSLKSTGKGACILPHGVLFRGNAEADIRRNLIQRGVIKGIIGLPPNLFFGTGIPACIVVLDKEGAAARKSIFMIDASKGFIKDGNKNRAQRGHPKALIETIAESLLATFRAAPLLDAYDVYQHLMDYWAETIQDDCYLIAGDGWKAGAQPREILKVKNKDGKLVWPETHDYNKGKRRFKSDLVPATILIARYFVGEQKAIEAIEAELATIEQQLDEQKEEQGGDEGLLAEVIEGEGDKQKITVKALKARLKEIGKDSEFAEERKALEDYTALLDKQADAKGRLKAAQEDLDAKLDAKYPKLTEDEIKTLVVDDKWLATLGAAVQGELDRVSQSLTGRIRELAERYATPLPQLTKELTALAARVDGHLKKMGAVWQ
jgi:type I restriction-modification system DNA methylase subunit